VTFKVTDTDNTADPNATTISIPVIVGDPSFRDVPPTFANQTIEIQPGEAPKTFDLRSASSHPNPALIQQLTYQKFVAPAGPISASLSGSTVSMSTNVDTPIGTTSVITFTVNLGSSFAVPGQLTVKVVASTRPLPQTVDHAEPNGRSSTSYTISPLVTDFNPFADQGKPLKITDVAFQGPDLGATGLTHTDSTVSVTTGTAKSGTINLIYTVSDATNSATREVQGRITVTVTSAPEPVTSFTVTGGSGTVSVVFQPPASSNGAPITGYTVRIAGVPGTDQRTDCTPGSTCTFSGRTNGQPQTVDVAATNSVGTTWSSTSTVVPYGTPLAPTNPQVAGNSTQAPAQITPIWYATSGDTSGGTITYQWNYTQGSSAYGSTTKTYGTAQTVGAGTYAFQVRACNALGLSGDPRGCSGYVSSAPFGVTNPPPPSPNMTITQPLPDHWIHLVISGYAPNTTYSIACWVTPTSSGQNGHAIGSFNVTTDASGGGTWDNPNTCTMTGGGYGNLRSTVVWSNTILLN
jgi:hypothetical protein